MLETVVFLSGAVVMILELAAARVLAPYLGTSLFVWTSLIGVILGSLSLGYWWGGRVADRWPERRLLSLTFVAAAAVVALIPAAQAPLLSSLAANAADLRWKSLAAAMLFALPAVLLGVVSPFAARLKMTDVSRSGRTVGGLYALSALGSITGTFVAGFWLIPSVGSTRLVLILAFVLLGCSVVCEPRSLLWVKLAVLGLWAGLAVGYANDRPLLPSGKLVLDRDTAYQRLVVFDLPVPNRQPVRVLSMGFSEYHSAMFLDRPNELALDYTRFFRMAPYLRPGIRRALCIGGGAVIYPRDLLRASPRTKVDVVELDPGVTRIAREYFGLTDDPRLTMYHEDGRVLLNRDGPAYDAVFLDVFWGRTIPFQLATLESARRIAARLTKDGVLLVNFVSAIEGPQGEFFRAEYATLRRVFPQVLIFAVFYPSEPAKVQNLILVALRSAAPPSLTGEEMRQYATHLWRQPIPGDMPVLTDDFAPVEQYAARQLEPDSR